MTETDQFQRRYWRSDGSSLEVNERLRYLIREYSRGEGEFHKLKSLEKSAQGGYWDVTYVRNGSDERLNEICHILYWREADVDVQTASDLLNSEEVMKGLGRDLKTLVNTLADSAQAAEHRAEVQAKEAARREASEITRKKQIDKARHNWDRGLQPVSRSVSETSDVRDFDQVVPVDELWRINNEHMFVVYLFVEGDNVADGIEHPLLGKLSVNAAVVLCTTSGHEEIATSYCVRHGFRPTMFKVSSLQVGARERDELWNWLYRTNFAKAVSRNARKEHPTDITPIGLVVQRPDGNLFIAIGTDDYGTELIL